MKDPFSTPFTRLPKRIPVFPLEDALLLPHGRLPLNIFEPRYIKMVEAALKQKRLLGMVQPRAALGEEDETELYLYPIGCLGRIIQFEETEDGRLQIVLQGVSRFEIEETLPLKKPYAEIIPDYSKFEEDLRPYDGPAIERQTLLELTPKYLKQEGIEGNFELFELLPSDRLVTTLALLCPFEPAEKQAILSARSLQEQAAIMVTMMQMALLQQGQHTVN